MRPIVLSSRNSSLNTRLKALAIVTQCLNGSRL